jgi:two-component system, sensor histidine kinase PdtaS
MKRLAHFDISRRAHAPLPRLATQVGFGIACGLAMIALRTFFDIWSPAVGPFALVYPTVLLATLYGHWQAGLVAWALSFGWAWYVVLPYPHSFEFADAKDLPRVGLNAASALIVLLFAETFRSAVEAGRLQSDAEIERRAILLAEMEHRTKNNFALVASLLEIQKRRESSDTVRLAFDDAIGRVRTFAEAYSHLADEQGEGAHVDMKPYLQRLVDRVGSAAFAPNVTITHEISDVSMARETAVAIGLFTNEALTNCAKYAFPDSRAGTVHVALEAGSDDWSLSIRDDGTGANAAPVDNPGSGIGSSLLGAFARQAGASHVVQSSDGGFTVELASAK